MTAMVSPTEWVRLRPDLYITTEPMAQYTDGKTFVLQIPDGKEIESHNIRAIELGHEGLMLTDDDLTGGGYPFQIMNKVATLRGMEAGDGSRLSTFSEFTYAAASAAIANASDGNAGLRKVYGELRKKWYATCETLRFHERLADGRYVADILRFSDGARETVAEGIKIAGSGFMEELGALHGYPTRTSSNTCRIQNMDLPGFDGLPIRDSSGFWYVGNDSVGQERIVLRVPYWYDEGLLSAYVYEDRSCSYEGVAALRVRDQ